MSGAPSHSVPDIALHVAESCTYHGAQQLLLLLLRTSRGAEYCDQHVCLCVCLSASISLETLDRLALNFLCRSPVAVARSSSGGVALHYVLPVLWMTSRLAVMGARASQGWQPSAPAINYVRDQGGV